MFPAPTRANTIGWEGLDTGRDLYKLMIIQLIDFTTFRTDTPAGGIEAKRMSVFADPAGLAGRVPGKKTVGRCRMGEHGAGADKGIGPDIISADDGSVGADGCPLTDMGPAKLILTGNGSP